MDSALIDFEEEATELVRNTIIHFKAGHYDKMKGEEGLEMSSIPTTFLEVCWSFGGESPVKSAI